MSKVNKEEVIRMFRILGVSVNASMDDIKSARNRLSKVYHPDKYPNLTESDEKLLNEKFSLVSNAFFYIKDNYDQIQKLFKYANEFQLTSKAHPILKSHYVYSAVANY